MSPEKAAAIPAFSTFQHPLVRDLCWVLTPAYDMVASLPPFERFLPPQAPAVLADWLRQLEHNPSPLEQFMADKTPAGADKTPARADKARARLGHHFERLVLFYLAHGPANPFTVHDHNRALYTKDANGHRTTRGELDFLLECAGSRLHLEVAVKFYLGVELGGNVHWLGPGLQDRLDRKLKHLQEHQLPLSGELKEPGSRDYKPSFWVKGLLCQPHAQILPLHPGLLPTAASCPWLTCAEALDTLEDLHHWVCLPKYRWLGCAWQDLVEVTVSAARLSSYFNSAKHALMLWHEESARRCLVVADDWPEAALAILEH